MARIYDSGSGSGCGSSVALASLRFALRKAEIHASRSTVELARSRYVRCAVTT